MSEVRSRRPQRAGSIRWAGNQSSQGQVPRVARLICPNALLAGRQHAPVGGGSCSKAWPRCSRCISVYDFKQSVDDGATVPLFYENRIPELQLTNEQLNENIYRAIEEAELDDEQQRKLERVLGKQYHLITREKRLDKIAADIVRHFTGRGFKPASGSLGDALARADACK